MKILMIDNYDSFTYNLVQYLRELTNTKITVVRNDEVPVDFVQDFDCIFISPGPGVPKDSGIIIEVIKKYAPHKPIFGVCLGLQAIGEAFGGNLTNLDQVYHGVHTPVIITDPGETIFAGIPSPFQAGRYHSWVVSKDNFPQDLVITAEDEHGMIMAASHRTYQVKGVQFHPESILTPDGKKILKNFLVESEAIYKKQLIENTF
ncbi:MAG: aminodeoxychorismate/anthranilate synthase component II [Saprospiraceae bacterium]|nr:aminodeoxychorismate/anthranilate synthase component II [Saprospiraceae bacterium]MBK8511886.1 aminodeoxychorismate/anthranilate synthase component II [Saprospiraceae bacterium]MBK9930484.1 aminodeoxychorismate/anthranilate synthase component II [Saprospiraceae bacterium]